MYITGYDLSEIKLVVKFWKQEEKDKFFKGWVEIMKKFIATTVLCLCMLLPISCFANTGVVAYTDDSIIVIADQYENYYCGEIYTYSSTERGDIIGGDFDNIGMVDLYNISKDETFSVYIDDIWLSREQAADWLRAQLNLF